MNASIYNKLECKDRKERGLVDDREEGEQEMGSHTSPVNQANKRIAAVYKSNVH